MTRPVNRNKSEARDPKWTGVGNEIMVNVSRGEPRRTDEQMIEVIAGQIERYLLAFGEEFDGTDLELINATVELIAADHVYGPGSTFVWFYRDHVYKYMRMAAGGSDA